MTGGVTQATIDFAPEGISAKADEICALMKAGIVNTVSIGFLPIETEPMDPSRPRGPQRYLRSSLMELSVVSVPANTDATAIARDAASGVTQPEAAVAPATTTPPTPVDRKRVARFVAGIKRKDLWDVGYLADVLSTIGWLVDAAAWEAACEGDGSKVPGMLADAMQALADALLAMTAEEVAEALADARRDVAQPDSDDGAGTLDFALMAAPSGVRKAMGVARYVARAGRVLSAANETDLQTAHEKIGGVLAQVGKAPDEPDDAAQKAMQAQRVRFLQLAAA
jgi:hypothetical protein